MEAGRVRFLKAGSRCWRGIVDRPASQMERMLLRLCWTVASVEAQAERVLV